jgi:hypothetical protein
MHQQPSQPPQSAAQQLLREVPRQILTLRFTDGKSVTKEPEPICTVPSNCKVLTANNLKNLSVLHGTSTPYGGQFSIGVLVPTLASGSPDGSFEEFLGVFLKVG